LALGLRARYYGKREWISTLVRLNHPEWRDRVLAALESTLEAEPTLANSHNEHGFTPIAVAADCNNVEAAIVLLRYGADPSKRFVTTGSRYGEEVTLTPLAIAIHEGHREFARLLAENGAEAGDIERRILVDRKYANLDDFFNDNRSLDTSLSDEDIERLWYGPQN